MRFNIRHLNKIYADNDLKTHKFTRGSGLNIPDKILLVLTAVQCSYRPHSYSHSWVVDMVPRTWAGWLLALWLLPPAKIPGCHSLNTSHALYCPAQWFFKKNLSGLGTDLELKIGTASVPFVTSLRSVKMLCFGQTKLEMGGLFSLLRSSSTGCNKSGKTCWLVGHSGFKNLTEGQEQMVGVFWWPTRDGGRETESKGDCCMCRRTCSELHQDWCLWSPAVFK